MMFSKRSRLLICGFYGHHNLGDEAMLAGMLCLLKPCLGPDYLSQITVYSNDPDDTARRHGVATLRNQFPRRRREQWRKWVEHTLALWRHQYFILGGGDLLRDSPQREVATAWLQPLQRAMDLGCQTIVLGISVGDIWRPETKAAIVHTLNQVNLIAVRDRQSQKQLQQIGVTCPINVISDLALQAISTQPPPGTAAVAPKIGISIRSLAGRLPHLDHAAEQRFYGEMAKIIDYLIEHKDAAISLLPFQAYPPTYGHRPVDDDEKAIAAVLEQTHHSQQITVHTAFDSIKQAIDTLKSLDLVIGTRLHSLILAGGLGIPLLAAVYDKKVSGFMAEIDQTENSIAVEQFTLATVKPRLDYLLTHQRQTRQAIEAAMSGYRQQIIPVADRLDHLFNS
ncbi:MAG: polysaccharide pyruvyl transferase family protein [Cyanobacteria bacterium P01_D01_bin.2]